jgi:hypothetical protein
MEKFLSIAVSVEISPDISPRSLPPPAASGQNHHEMSGQGTSKNLGRGNCVTGFVIIPAEHETGMTHLI